MVSSAARVGSINVLFSATYDQAVTGTNRFASAVEAAGGRASRAATSMDRSVQGLNTSLSRLNTRTFSSLSISALKAGDGVDRLRGLLLAASSLAAGFTAAFAIRGIQEYSDAWKEAGNKLRIATTEGQSLASVQDKVFDVAQRSRASYESTATLFSRMSVASQRLGISQEDVLRTTETIQKAMLVGGATPIEAKQSILQLSQGLGANRLQGQDLRAVLENQAIGKLLADQISGGDLGKLRQMATQGQLTAGIIIKAFRDASGQVDKLFANTDETISQAFVKIDNAIEKYVGTSGAIGTSSRATINVLEALAANIDTVVNSLIILAGAATAVFAANRVNGIASWVSSLREGSLAAKEAAVAEATLAEETAAAARSDWVQKRLAFNKALNDGSLSASQLARQQKVLAASTATARDTAAAAALAQDRLTTATNEARLGTVALTAAGRAFSAVWSFIGGPVGAAFLAIGAAMYVVEKNANDAQERNDRYADAIKRAGDNSHGAAPGIKEAAASLDLVTQAATSAEKQVSLATATTDVSKYSTQLSSTIQELGTLSNSWSTIPMQQQLQDLTAKFLSGKLSLDDYIKSVDTFAAERPDASPILAQIESVAKYAAAAMGAVDALNKSIDGIGGPAAAKEDRIPQTLTDDQFNARFGQPYSKSYKQLFPSLFKPPKRTPAVKKTPEDAFNQDIQGVKNRTAALKEETDTLGLSYFEQQKREESLKLEQKALKDTQEAARKKGDTDWQNAQLTPDQIKQIDAASDAYARQADELRKAKEMQQLESDVLKTAFDDMRTDIEDGTFGWKTFEKVALDVLNKIIDKIENDLIDSILHANSATTGAGSSSGGILGWLFKGIGSLLGASSNVNLPDTAPIPTPRPQLDSGGSLLSSGLVSFGPKTRMLQADSGIGPKNFLSVLHEGESVLTGKDMSRTIGVIAGASSALKDRGGAAYNDNRTIRIDARGAQQGVGQEIAAALAEYDQKTLPVRIKQINADPRARG